MRELIKIVGTRLTLLALLIRILIMPFYFHPDIKTFNYQVSFLKKGVANIYKHLATKKGELTIREDFVYFPSTYFLLGSYETFVSSLAGNGFNSWLSDASAGSTQNPSVFRYLFLLKSVFLLFDLLITVLLIKFLKKESSKKSAALFWLFNPFTIWIIYAYSNFDVVVSFLTFLSLYLFKSKKNIFSYLILGIASSIKAYPLLLLPFFLFSVSSKEKMKATFFTLLPLVVTIVPFLSREFLNSALVSGLTTRIFSPGVSIGMGETIIPATFVIILIYLSSFLHEGKMEIWTYTLSLFIALFSFTHFHISWLIWMMPFVSISWAVKPKKINVMLVFFILILFFIPLFYRDRFMAFGLLSAVSSLYKTIPLPNAAVDRIYDVQTVTNVAHTVAAAVGILSICKILKLKNI